MNIDPVAVLAVISGQAERIAELESDNAQLRTLLATCEEPNNENDNPY